jgi:diacylglycerol kinase (ATP)
MFGPAATAQALDLFRAPGVEFTDSIPGSDVALVFGGDGTIHRFLPQVWEGNIPLLAVPTGSGNDFHREIGTGTVELAVKAWEAFRAGKPPRAIDLGMITNVEGEKIPYCCVAGIGLDSDANLRANAMPNWLKRHGGYTVAGVQSIFTYTPKRVRATTAEGQVIDALATIVAIGMAPAYGDGIYITPRAQFDDGKLDLCFVKKIGKLRLSGVFVTVFKGKHLGLKEVDYIQTASLRIETDVPMRIHADGEHAGHTPAEFRVLPKALKVIVP